MGSDPNALLLERDAELEAVEAALTAAAAGSGRLVLVEGPAGKGKTALLAAARHRARRAGIRVLAVPPRHRGLGIGRRLTAACIELAREEGAAGIGLMTTEMMAVAKGMYERMGFEQMKEYQTDYPVRFWAYGMRLGGGARDS